MNTFRTLLQREWLQNRFAWSLMVLIPLALLVPLLVIGDVQFDADNPPPASVMPLLLTLGSMAGVSTLLTLIALVASAFTVFGLARRDHADRSVEFWLSLPVGHAQHFAAPLLVHLLLVPLAALALGLAAGALLSSLLVARLGLLGQWLALPWLDVIQLAGAILLRAAAGLPLALLWLSPWLLLSLLLYAWLKRWGPVVMVASVGFTIAVEEAYRGSSSLAKLIASQLEHAAHGLVHPVAGMSPQMEVTDANIAQVLGMAPRWAAQNLMGSIGDLASPLPWLGALVAAALFFGLIDWRRRGAATLG